MLARHFFIGRSFNSGTRAYDQQVEATNPAPECAQCGDRHSPVRCPWADTCDDCGRPNAAMAEPRLCEDCEEARERVAARERTDAIREGRGDYMRDQQKDGAR